MLTIFSSNNYPCGYIYFINTCISLFCQTITRTAFAFSFRWGKLEHPPWLYGCKVARPVVTNQRSVTMKVAMHPFGREAETSLRDLFEYFKRCLQHGEWELANACVPQLVNSTGGLSENLRSIIKAIVCHPYNLKWVTQLRASFSFSCFVCKNKSNLR